MSLDSEWNEIERMVNEIDETKPYSVWDGGEMAAEVRELKVLIKKIGKFLTPRI